MNVGQLLTEIEGRTGVAYDRARMLSVLNEALQSIAGEQNWDWLEATATLTGNGTSSYTLPADFHAARALVVDENPMPMVPVGDIDVDTQNYGWTINAGELVVAPAPATGATLVLRYVRDEPDLADDEDEPLLPSRWHWALVNYAAYIVLDRVGDTVRAQARMASYEDSLRKMKRSGRQATGPFRVRTRPGSML